VPHLASRPGRARRRTLLGVALLAVASAAFAVRRPLLMSAGACSAGRWHGCFDTFNGVVLMTVVALPLAALVVWALARRRLAAGVPSAWALSSAEVGMVYGTLPFVWLVLMPGSGAGIVPSRLSLVPLQDLPTMGLLGIVGNLLVFAALGFFAPMRFAALASVPRITALAAGCSLLIETAQYALQLASRRWWRAGPTSPSDRRRPSRATRPRSPR